MTQIVFWQEALSIHRAPVIRALSAVAGLQVSAVSFDSVSVSRRAMGWEAPDYGQARVEIFEPAQWRSAAEAHGDADIHVFAGFGAWPGMREVQAQLAKTRDAKMFVLTEPWDDRGFKGFLRLLRAGRRVQRLGPHLAGVLPCGNRAKKQLQGFSALHATPFYDFGYFVDASDTPLPVPEQRARLIFVGAMAEWKAPLMLVQALAALRQFDWHLDMYGEGDQAAAVQREITTLRLEDRVRLQGYQPYPVIRQAIANSDVLILPSAHDGWGAVINEALMDGTRVVVSDAAGASDLVTHTGLGGCFTSGDRSSLEDTLREALNYPRDQATRRAVKEWSDRAISPEAAAEYLHQIMLNLPNPVRPPWQEIVPSLRD